MDMQQTEWQAVVSNPTHLLTFDGRRRVSWSGGGPGGRQEDVFLSTRVAGKISRSDTKCQIEMLPTEIVPFSTSHFKGPEDVPECRRIAVMKDSPCVLGFGGQRPLYFVTGVCPYFFWYSPIPYWRNFCELWIVLSGSWRTQEAVGTDHSWAVTLVGAGRLSGLGAVLVGAVFSGL